MTKEMGIVFYLFPGSLPCKVVWSVLEELGIQYEKKYLDIFGKKEQNSQEYRKINPDGKVPFILDGDFGLGESRAIICYLCSKYEDRDKKEKLYPVNLEEKAEVDKALYEDFQYSANMVEYLNLVGVLYRGGESGPVESRWPGIVEMLERLEERLKRHEFMASDHLTVADFSALGTVGGFQYFIPEEEKLKYPLLLNWMERMKALPMYQICYGDSPAQFKAFYDKAVKK